MRIGTMSLTVFAVLALMVGCTSPPVTPTTMSTEGSMLVRTAHVTEVRDIAVRGGINSGIGTAVGAILGSLAGGRIGSGHGSTAASIGGAIAGSLAGGKLEQAGTNRSAVELTLRFDSGDVRSYRIETDDGFRVGDTVKVITGNGETRITR